MNRHAGMKLPYEATVSLGPFLSSLYLSVTTAPVGSFSYSFWFLSLAALCRRACYRRGSWLVALAGHLLTLGLFVAYECYMLDGIVRRFVFATQTPSPTPTPPQQDQRDQQDQQDQHDHRDEGPAYGDHAAALHHALTILGVLATETVYLKACVTPARLVPLVEMGPGGTRDRDRDGWTTCKRCGENVAATEPTRREAARPPRAAHCKIIDRCVLRYDHYCPWIRQTVGNGNYQWFIAVSE